MFPLNQKATASIGALVMGAICFLVSYIVWSNIDIALAGAASGQAVVATSSTIQVGPQQIITIFDANSACANRRIDTAGMAVTLSFHTAITPSELIGHRIAASSTGELDSDLYGCGAVRAFAVASTTITKTEFSQ